MLLPETDIQSEPYSHNRLGYKVTCSAMQPSSAGGAQGGVDMVMRERPGRWGIQSTRFQGPNVIICEIVTVHTRTSLIGAYLPPSTLKHLLDFDETLQCFKGLDPIFLGNFNVDLDKSRSLQSQPVAELLMEFGLIDQVRQFQQRRWFWYLMNWTQVRQGTVLYLRCDYILRADRRRFEIFGTRDMRNYTSDHFEIRKILLRYPT